MTMKPSFVLPLLLLAAACTAQTPPAEPTPGPPVAPPSQPLPASTLVKDRAAFERLLGNSGVTLQWIGWDRRGTLTADHGGDLLRLRGGQAAASGAGALAIDGVVTEVGADYFIFVGRIDVTDTPDVGRDCRREGEMTFRVTQNRQYWRLQQMEVCDGLTDYVDVYF